jgi:hypothetical protein
VAIKLIQAANKAIEETLKRNDLRKEVRDILSNISIPVNDMTFITPLQTSLAKLYILYTTWYYDVLLQGSPSNQQRTLNQLVGIAKKHLVTPTDDVRKLMKALFLDLPLDIQQNIQNSPDNTGIVSRTLRYFKPGSVYESIELVTNQKHTIAEDISTSVNSSDEVEDLLDISSEQSMMRAIMKGIVQLRNPANPMTFPAFEAFVVSNFFSSWDEKDLDKKVGRFGPMEFVGDDGEIREKQIAASAEREGDVEAIATDESSVASEADPETKDWDLTSLDSGGVWKGINLFHEIDNGNFSALFSLLLKKKYIDGKADIVIVPETIHGDGSREESGPKSLFEWLLSLSPVITKSSSIEGELYSYNEALIDFINIYSEELRDSMGSSIPAGGISDEQMARLVKATELFGRKYSIPALQGIANRSVSQKLANTELYARTTKVGGTNFDKLKQFLKFDFISLVGSGIMDDKTATIGAKQDALSSLDQINSISSPVTKYLAVLKLLYKFNPDHGSNILKQAIRSDKDDKEIYSPIHNTVKGIITGLDEKGLVPAKKRGFKDLDTFGIHLPATYPPAETLLFSPVNTIENYIKEIEQAHLESLGIDAPLKDIYYYKEHLLKKLHTILALKKQAEPVNEAVEPTVTKTEFINFFVRECLPIMDSVLADGRRLVRFLRNFVRSSKPVLYFDPTDPLIQRNKSGDFRRTQKAVSEPAQQVGDGIENRGLSTAAIYSLIRGYLYNLSANHDGLFVEIFDAQEKATLKKLIGLLTNFAMVRLKKDPNVLEGDLDNFLYELKLVDAQIRNPEVKEVNLDGIKKYLRLFKPIILDGLLSIKNGQSNSVTMLLRFLASNTLGHVIGLNQGDLVTSLKKDAESAEEISKSSGRTQLRPKVAPALVPYADFDTEED